MGPVFLDAHGADPRSVDVPNTRAIVTFYFGAPVLPCRRHQCMHSSLSRALPLPRSLWREASRRDAGMARRSAPWGRKDGRSFPSTAKVPSFPAHRRWVSVRRGSAAAGAAAACNITHLSPRALALAVTDLLPIPHLRSRESPLAVLSPKPQD